MANIIGDAEYWPGEADIVACFLCLVISIGPMSRFSTT